MDFLGDLISLGGAAVTGGLTGVLGFGVKALFGWLGEREKRATLKMQNEHELALLDKQIAARGQELEREAEIAAEATRQKSYDFANVRQEVWKWVASVVTLMRPALTVACLAMSAYILLTILNGKAVPYVDVKPLVKELVTLFVYLTSTSVTWWFGDRPPQTRK